MTKKQVLVVTDTGNPVRLDSIVAALGSTGKYQLTVAAPSQVANTIGMKSWDVAVLELGAFETLWATRQLGANNVPIIAVTASAIHEQDLRNANIAPVAVLAPNWDLVRTRLDQVLNQP